MTFQRTKILASALRRADARYGMIEPGDRIAVGLSGGKDSLALLCLLHEVQRYHPCDFSLVALTVDAGFAQTDYAPLTALCAEMGIPHTVIPTRIADLVFQERQESNPCSLCARLRRGALLEGAKEAGCGKLALGHHLDDLVDTFLLNLFYEGRLAAFAPVTPYTDRSLTMIRPLILAKESDISYFMRQNPDLPIVQNRCPEDKQTEREEIKRFLSGFERAHKGVRHRIFVAMEKGNIEGLGESDPRE